MKRRFSTTFSATQAEIDRLDAWAHHHNMSRSEAVRSFIMAIKIDGQTALDDFDDVEPHPEAVEAAELASQRPVLRVAAPKGSALLPRHQAGSVSIVLPNFSVADVLGRKIRMT